MRHVAALGERRSFGDGHGFSGAGLHAFARQTVGGGKSPGIRRRSRGCRCPAIRFRPACRLGHFLWRDRAGECPSRARRRRWRRVACAVSMRLNRASRFHAAVGLWNAYVAFGPGCEIVLLLGSELVHLHAHGFELELGDLPVDRLGHGVDLRLELGWRASACIRRESAWLAKLISITAAGCPSAAARLIRRPSPSR